MVGTLIAAVSSSARRSMTYLALLPVAFGVLWAVLREGHDVRSYPARELLRRLRRQ
jgi:hypothetical protein